ncbi:hypothetical protein LMIY3S_01807 [Labrys miyagiensis]
MTQRLDQPIAVIRKNARSALRISLVEREGRLHVDVRLVAQNARGDLTPTSAGISVRPELLELLIQALQKAEAELRVAHSIKKN